MQLLIKLYIILIGFAIGSYLNVLIYRIPLKISTMKGNSFCPKCNHRLSWLDLFPLFSYVFLGGKCRYCKEKISLRYPLIEALNAISYILIYIKFGFSIQSAVYALVASCLIILAFIDIDHKIIPDRFNIIIGICGLALIFTTNNLTWLDRVIGFFAVSTPFFIIAIITGGIGEGDVKLFAVCGLLLGWQNIILAMIISSIVAAIVGVILIAGKGANGKTAIPLGPFISLAVFICMLYGNNIIQYYLSLL